MPERNNARTGAAVRSGYTYAAGTAARGGLNDRNKDPNRQRRGAGWRRPKGWQQQSKPGAVMVGKLENNQDLKAKIHGGARKGAGRKAGSATKRTREIADRAMADGITPLEYMLQVMRTEPAGLLEPREAMAAVVMRFEAAKAAAPYIHPRLAAIEHSGPDGAALAPPTIIISKYADE